jgi:hypothetical protein
MASWLFYVGWAYSKRKAYTSGRAMVSASSSTLLMKPFGAAEEPCTSFCALGGGDNGGGVASLAVGC